MERTTVHQEKKTAVKSDPFIKPTIQKKLSVGSANDSYEVEADRMADRVMRISDSQPHNIAQTGALIQKKCSACEQEEKLQMKPLADSITPLIQRSSHGESGGHAPSHIEVQINGSKGGGSYMDHSTQHFMESRFGTDFSDVKIHTGSQAVQMSRELNAVAFTVGNDIYFNEGKYNPQSDSGKHLLAHELTHTVQQGGGVGRKVQKFVTCENGESCPGREQGESIRSRSSRIGIDMIADHTLVFSRFDISSDSMDNFWSIPHIRSIINNWAAEPNQNFDIKGYTDCGGGEIMNTGLRNRRANSVFSILPVNIQSLVNYQGAAPLTECLSSNQTEFGRSVNRAAIIKKNTINMADEHIIGQLPTPEITVTPLHDERGDRETDRELERSRRRRDIDGGRSRVRGGDIDSDWAGRAILGRWLTGSGNWQIYDSTSWSSYMRASLTLREQLRLEIIRIVREGIERASILGQNRFAIYSFFQAEVENGEGMIGYNYLHGTNADVGGFIIYGEGIMEEQPDGNEIIRLNLHYQWNDIIDPNPEYGTDTLKSIFGEFITLGQAESYEINITWEDNSSMLLNPTTRRISNTSGYPFN